MRHVAWDPESEQVYVPRGPRPRVTLVVHEHQCPDGTLVVVHAQYVRITDVTLYRWTINGKTADPTGVRGDHRTVAPDWTRVDAAHRKVA